METTSGIPGMASKKTDRGEHDPGLGRRRAFTGVMAAAAILMSLALRPGPAEAGYSCGGTVGGGGPVLHPHYDIHNCSANPVLTIVGPVFIDMGGHEISCSGSNDGIKIIGQGAVVKHGKVTYSINNAATMGCAQGIIVAGAGHHQLSDMMSDNAIHAGILSDHNTLSHSLVYETGCTLPSDAAPPWGDGITVAGKANVLKDNIATRSVNDGFRSSPAPTRRT